ncbi:VOC family protein [Priestia flexa]|uniref:VOC family protein n=1 Tax=Priestia flexa TaxID=86664 RepID=UPI0032EE4D41
MITHYANLELRTVSIQGVKQFYEKALHLEITNETTDFIQFRLTPYSTLSFKESYEPIKPAHFAIQVSYQSFTNAVTLLKESGVFLLAQNEENPIDEHNGRKNVYFRDCDGHLLELIAHDYIHENKLKGYGKLNALYIREIGFPVKDVGKFRSWLKENFNMKTVEDNDYFNFVIGGTAYAVVVSEKRPWIPIAMKALPPNIKVTLGTPFTLTDSNQCFVWHDYQLSLVHTPEFQHSILQDLRLPPVCY